MFSGYICAEMEVVKMSSFTNKIQDFVDDCIQRICEYFLVEDEYEYRNNECNNKKSLDLEVHFSVRARKK